MNLLSYLERKKIMSHETLMMFAVILLVYALTWLCWKIGFIPMAYGLSLIVLGGTCNLYAISYNDCKMPVFVKSKSEFEELKKRNPKRRICMLNLKTKFGRLADRFRIGKRVYSIGDFLTYGGVLLMLVSSFYYS